jgi:Amiloride-sensitive sodium channel
MPLGPLRDNLEISFYFGRLQYTKYEETQILDQADFLANLGAIIGTWTGMSGVTFAQLIVFFIAFAVKGAALLVKKIRTRFGGLRQSR